MAVSVSYLTENAVLLQWPEKICPRQHAHIMACQQELALILKDSVIDSVVSFASLLVYYRFDKIDFTSFDKTLQMLADKHTNHLLCNDLLSKDLQSNDLLSNASLCDDLLSNASLCDDNTKQFATPSSAISQKQVVKIPVYYGEEAGWDLVYVAQQTGLSIKEVIQGHSQNRYYAYALGFTPGFCYLGTLAPALHLPRRNSPRIKVPKGAVAIAEQQTAVYPNTSPGGWHILGQTPCEMYRVADDDESEATRFIPKIDPGNIIQFEPITLAEFLALGGKVALAS